ncbi:hypothetical protein LZD49_33240 [Dyadobacter sp. CY261]|uniref:hypothetical protein n=1 Tax=Dyadobacter sp. CY261 TaxID=2907203 RepID=UPI001F404849|nr:hypothetical protein [Dyadobacter sp. CY261]MCF0075391.1 hypothetical protein [Dyadobacter sp. CY261]
MKQTLDKPWRNIWLKIDAEQYDSLQAQRASTTCRSLTEYIRRLVCQQPVTVNYRDASLEDLITELSIIRRHLATAAEALALSAEKVSQTYGAEQQSWLEAHQKDREVILGHIQQIYQHTKQVAIKWLQ